MSFTFPARVYIEDTDLGGIVYYVNYLKFMERARTEFLRHHGFEQQQLKEDGIIFVVQNVACQYHKPAQLDDELHISVVVERLGGASIVFLQKVMRGDECLCEGRVTVVQVNADTMRPSRFSAAMRQALTI